MGQSFCFVNLDAGVALKLGKLREGILYIGIHEHLAPRAVGRLVTLEELRLRLASLPRYHAQKQSRLLAVLPADVIRHVFDCFRDTEDDFSRIDAACLALTCQLCFAVGHSALKRHHAAWQSWAGHRLIIAGEYQPAGDIPPGLELPASWTAEEGGIYDASLETLPAPRRERLREAFITSVIQPMYQFAVRVGRRKVAAVDRLARLWAALFVAGDEAPKDKDLVLRNLSKKEYVRGDVLDAKKDEYMRLWGHDTTGFTELRVGDLAAFHICWDSYTDLERVARCAWAGDRFDVVVASQANLGGWKDVSEFLVRKVHHVCQKHFS